MLELKKTHKKYRNTGKKRLTFNSVFNIFVYQLITIKERNKIACFEANLLHESGISSKSGTTLLEELYEDSVA